MSMYTAPTRMLLDTAADEIKIARVRLQRTSDDLTDALADRKPTPLRSALLSADDALAAVLAWLDTARVR